MDKGTTKRAQGNLVKKLYRIEKVNACTVVYGNLPMTVMARIFARSAKSAVMDGDASSLLGASLVVGTPKAIQKLKANAPKRRVPAPWREKIGEGACAWVEAARVGRSSNYFLFRLTGFNAMAWLKSGEVTAPVEVAYPFDPADLRRCRLLLEAEPSLQARLPEMFASHPVWARLVLRWEELCAVMDEESPEWREDQLLKPSPRTQALLDKIEKQYPVTKSPRLRLIGVDEAVIS